MSDTELLAVGVVAIITAFSSLALVVLKLIKKSTCCGIAFETRTPTDTNPHIILSQPPSPEQYRHTTSNQTSV